MKCIDCFASQLCTSINGMQCVPSTVLTVCTKLAQLHIIKQMSTGVAVPYGLYWSLLTSTSVYVRFDEMQTCCYDTSAGHVHMCLCIVLHSSGHLSFKTRTCQCSGNALDMCSGGAHFESKPEHYFCMVILSPSWKMPGYYFDYAKIAFFQILSN
jgi:hypothetical protein